MKIFLLFFVLLAASVLVVPLFNESETNESETTDEITGLPWQVDIFPDGSTRVFGLHLGVARLSDVLGILGEGDVELAIVAATDEVGSLEMYYGHYRAGVIAGKLVVRTSTSEKNIKNWRENAPKFDYMASGKAKKYILLDDDLKQVLDEVVTGLTFVPSVNLDEEIIRARFGEPDQRIELEGVVHFLYPVKGLNIAIFDNAKEVIQYVVPSNFRSMVEVGL